MRWWHHRTGRRQASAGTQTTKGEENADFTAFQRLDCGRRSFQRRFWFRQSCLFHFGVRSRRKLHHTQHVVVCWCVSGRIFGMHGVFGEALCLVQQFDSGCWLWHDVVIGQGTFDGGIAAETRGSDLLRDCEKDYTAHIKKMRRFARYHGMMELFNDFFCRIRGQPWLYSVQRGLHS